MLEIPIAQVLDDDTQEIKYAQPIEKPIEKLIEKPIEESCSINFLIEPINFLIEPINFLNIFIKKIEKKIKEKQIEKIEKKIKKIENDDNYLIYEYFKNALEKTNLNIMFYKNIQIINFVLKQKKDFISILCEKNEKIKNLMRIENYEKTYISIFKSLDSLQKNEIHRYDINFIQFYNRNLYQQVYDKYIKEYDELKIKIDELKIKSNIKDIIDDYIITTFNKKENLFIEYDLYMKKLADYKKENNIENPIHKDYFNKYKKELLDLKKSFKYSEKLLYCMCIFEKMNIILEDIQRQNKFYNKNVSCLDYLTDSRELIEIVSFTKEDKEKIINLILNDNMLKEDKVKFLKKYSKERLNEGKFSKHYILDAYSNTYIKNDNIKILIRFYDYKIFSNDFSNDLNNIIDNYIYNDIHSKKKFKNINEYDLKNIKECMELIHNNKIKEKANSVYNKMCELNNIEELLEELLE